MILNITTVDILSYYNIYTSPKWSCHLWSSPQVVKKYPFKRLEIFVKSIFNLCKFGLWNSVLTLTISKPTQLVSILRPIWSINVMSVY